MASYDFTGGTDGDWDKPANFTPARNSPAVDDIIGVDHQTATNPWDTGPAAPQTIGQLTFKEFNGNGMPAAAANLTITGDATYTEIFGGHTFYGVVGGTLTIIEYGPAGSFVGTANGPVVMAGPSGSSVNGFQFSGATLTGVDSLTINTGGTVKNGTWPNVATIVNSGGYLLGGTYAGPVTFKSGSYCGHPAASAVPEFDNTVTFQSGANVYEINADGDTIFESASWSLTCQGYWPWDMTDVYLEGGDITFTAQNLGININGKLYPEAKTATPKLHVNNGVGGASNMEIDMSELPAPAAGGGGVLMPL